MSEESPEDTLSKCKEEADTLAGVMRKLHDEDPSGFRKIYKSGLFEFTNSQILSARMIEQFRDCVKRSVTVIGQ